jgi:hypothetical protein
VKEELQIKLVMLVIILRNPLKGTWTKNIKRKNLLKSINLQMTLLVKNLLNLKGKRVRKGMLEKLEVLQKRGRQREEVHQSEKRKLKVKSKDQIVVADLQGVLQEINHQQSKSLRLVKKGTKR